MASWPYESIHDGYTIVNSSLSGTAASKLSCWLEYKIISQSVANNTSTIRFYVFLATSGTSQFDTSCSNLDSNSRGAMSVSVDGSSVYNRIGRGFATSRIPYRDEYITQYQEPYDTALGYQYLMILTDNASSESYAYGEYTIGASPPPVFCSNVRPVPSMNMITANHDELNAQKASRESDTTKPRRKEERKRERERDRERRERERRKQKRETVKEEEEEVAAMCD